MSAPRARVRRTDASPADTLDRLRAALTERRDVGFAYLFGSAAGRGGGAHPHSDVDVAVWLGGAARGPADQDVWLALLRVLQNALGREDVDLLLLHRAPPLLAERIVRMGTLVFSRNEPARLRWIVETKSRYCDLRPLRVLLDAVEARRVQRGAFGRSGG